MVHNKFCRKMEYSIFIVYFLLQGSKGLAVEENGRKHWHLDILRVLATAPQALVSAKFRITNLSSSRL